MVLNVSTDTLDMGDLSLGTSVTESITLTNNGTGTMNVSNIKKTGDTFSLLNDSVKWKSLGIKIKDGNYKVGIRPHNITTYKEGNNSVEIKGKVLISELSGSESLIHFRNDILDWVSLSKGMGIDAKKVHDTDQLYSVFKDALNSQGPFLIEVMI